MIPVCPKCDIALFLLHFQNVEVDFCERCRGVWLDAGELESLMETTGADGIDPLRQFQSQAGKSQNPGRHLCPRCDSRLEEITLAPKVTLDQCPRGHGLWFDADELQQLLALYPATSNAGQTIAYLNEIFGAQPKT